VLFQIHNVVEIEFGDLTKLSCNGGRPFATVDVNVKTADGKKFRLTCFTEENVKLKYEGALIEFPKQEV